MYAWRQKLFHLILIGATALSYQSSAWAGRNGMRWDKTPDAFQFVDQTDVPLSTLIDANTITVSGINTSISVAISGGEYSINGGAFTSASSKVNNGDSISVRQTSSGQYSTTTHAVLDLNGVSDSFDVTTLANSTDTTPDTFSFIDQSDVALNTLVESNAITVGGINAATTISIDGGEYAINGGAYTSTSSSVNNGDQVVVRQASSANYATTTHATLAIGGVSDTFSVTTLADTSDNTPDAFSFIDQTDVALSTTIESNTITVGGINTATTISIDGGEYAVNGGAYTSTSSSVNNGDQVVVRQASSANYSTTTHATLAIGGVSDTFSVTTLADTSDTTPDAFSFIDQTDVELNTLVESNTIMVGGINSAASISISGGEYAVNGGAYMSTNGSVNNGDQVTVRQTSSSGYQTTTNTMLTIGGVSDIFSVTTLADANLTFQLPPQPSGNASFTSEHFLGSDNCTMCHNGLSDNQGQDVSIETDWSATMMANSARDPFWKAKVRTELNRNPQLADVINDKCTRCHAPMANFEAKSNNETIVVLDNGFLDANHPRHDEAMNGVSCTLCHQIQDAPTLGTLDGFTGHYEIGNNKEIYGPYDNLFPNPMIMNTGYTPMYSIHTQESELCSTCHNLKTPYVDEFGNVLSSTPESEFPEQMPYSEWLHSDYAGTQSCQQCHMARANGVPISNRPMWLSGRDNFAIHEFVGANKLMLNMLNDNKQQLGVPSNNFTDILAATEVMLQSSANIELVSQSLNAGQLDFTLQINSQTGHKLPSAYPSRRAIVHVTVTDAQNTIVFESGKVNADGSVQGVDADVDATAFEPHYDLITSPDQVQVYEAIMGDNNNEVTYTLLRGMSYLKDNRLLPAGFNKATAPDDVAVAGTAFDDNNFIGGSDRISYRIADLPAGSYTVQAELVYQTLAFGFARDLFEDPSAEVNDFKKMYNESTNKSTVLTSLQFVAQ
ncbi:multiheme c-type cytochrome [Methylomarinum vadi]|uniref:multiheme c-type cytochrome n=1 Tax=Methylomarinum vadi TaxID=438855 RepID=UPI0006918635|nr:multiheme c-type cytochrome [Methylomarinum vadi]